MNAFAAIRDQIRALKSEMISGERRSDGLPGGDRLVSALAKLDTQGIAAVRRSLEEDDLTGLAMYAHRSYERAASGGQTGVLDRALFAHLLSYPMSDWREWLILASLFPRSAELVGVDPELVFRRVGATANTDAAKAMSDFLKRSPENRSIGIMGWQEVWSDTGVRFVHSPPRRQTATIEEIAERFKRTDHR